jgi:O-antigen/teichoic acid export membrane protein
MNSTARLIRIALNAVAIGGGEVANKASTFLVYAVVSRLLGLEPFGQLALGLTLLYTSHVLGCAGLPTTIIRLVARRPRSAKRYLLYGYVAACSTSILATLAMMLIAVLMRYQPVTTQVICILALAVPFYSLTMVAEAVIKGRERMHLIAVGNLPGNALLVLGSIAVMQWGFGISAVAGMVVLSRLTTFLCMHFLVWLSIKELRTVNKVKLGLVRRLLGRSAVFLWTEGVAAIGASLFGLMLSKFSSEKEVGMLNAAFQLLQPIQILYRSVGHSSFPPLVSAARQGKQAVTQLAQQVLGLMIRIAFPACLVMFVMAADFLNLIYGDKGFAAGAFVLQILAFSLLFDPLSPVLGHGLWAVGIDRVVFKIVLINVCLSLIIGLLMISNFGLQGAAIAALASSIVNTGLHYLFFSRHIGSPGLFREAASLAPAIMFSLLVVLLSPWSRWVSLPIALTVYLVLAIVISILTSGLPYFTLKNSSSKTF